MKDYFKTKIGQTITKTVSTGVNCFTDVCKRRYDIEIIGIKGTELHVYVTSRDLTSSDIPYAGKDIDFGDLILDIKKFNTLNNIYYEIICRLDTKFVTKYPQVLENFYDVIYP